MTSDTHIYESKREIMTFDIYANGFKGEIYCVTFASRHVRDISYRPRFLSDMDNQPWQSVCSHAARVFRA